MVLLFSLATGMLCDMAMGPYQGKETGEPALFRELLDRLAEGDIVLADRYYCSYFMIALLMELGVDLVVRLHQARPNYSPVPRRKPLPPKRQCHSVLTRFIVNGWQAVSGRGPRPARERG